MPEGIPEYFITGDQRIERHHIGANVMAANLIPVKFCKCQVVASGAMEIPEESLALRRIQKGVSF